MVALTGLLRLTTKVSVDSAVVSPSTGTVTVCVSRPGVNVSVPEVVV